MRDTGVIGLLMFAGSVLVTGCGNGGEEPLPESNDAGRRVERIALPCTECFLTAVAPISQPSTSAKVTAYPTSLMFYGDPSSASGLAPQQVAVVNETHDAVEITKLYVLGDPSPGANPEGALYFSVSHADDAGSPGSPLRHGDSTLIDVSFLRSSVQRMAVLVIETSHTYNPTLQVDLAGKFFTSGW